MTRLSVVIPCYNESANLAELHRRLTAVLDAQPGPIEFVLVDDGSRDDTAAAIRALAERDPRVRGLLLSRNFGHQAALSAGIAAARGQAVIVMDADLQHPPEVIPQMLERWQAGFELIYAYRAGVRPRLGYRLMNRLLHNPIPAEAADFRLMDRMVVNAFLAMPERTRFLRGMMSWLGFKQTGIAYQQQERFAGERAYTFRQTLRMALFGVLSFSTVPLRVAAVVGFATLCLGLLYALYILFAWIAGWPLEKGWPALIMTVLILGGVQLLCLGIIAEYIGRIFDEVKQRPLYVVREEITARSSDSPPQDSPAPPIRDVRCET